MIKESRSYKISKKIIKIENIKLIADIIKKEIEIDSKNNNPGQIEIKIFCADNTSYESADFDILSNNVLKSKTPSKIGIDYWNFKINKRIHLSLEQEIEEKSYTNYLDISGNDSNWVNGVLTNIVEIIESFEPQDKNRRVILNLIHILISLIIGKIILFLILIRNTDIDPSEFSKTTIFIRSIINYNIITYELFVLLVCYIIGYLPSSLFTERFKKLWPNIEFQIGPEHRLMIKRRRTTLIKIFIFVVLPLILMIIYDIFTNLTASN